MFLTARHSAHLVLLAMLFGFVATAQATESAPKESEAITSTSESSDAAQSTPPEVLQRIDDLETELDALRSAVYGEDLSGGAANGDANSDSKTGFEVQVGTGSLRIGGLLQA